MEHPCEPEREGKFKQRKHGVKACGVRVKVGRRPQKDKLVSRKLIHEPAGLIFTIVLDLEAKELIPGA